MLHHLKLQATGMILKPRDEQIQIVDDSTALTADIIIDLPAYALDYPLPQKLAYETWNTQKISENLTESFLMTRPA